MKYHYRFTSHIYHVFINNKFIILDSKKDKYIFIDPPDANLLLHHLTFAQNRQHKNYLPNIIQTALHRKIIETSPHPGQLNFQQEMPQGIDMHRWRLPENSDSHPIKFHRAIPTILKFIAIRVALRTRGLDYIFQQLHRALQARHPGMAASNDIESVCHNIRRTALYLPFRTACLEHALVTAFYLARQAAPCEFRIGIQLAPFMAHAWVNHEGKVMLDKPDLNQSMITLVNIKSHA